MMFRQALLVATALVFSSSAFAAGEKCYNKADGSEVSTITTKKECKAVKGNVWSKHAPKVKGDVKPSTQPTSGSQSTPGTPSAPVNNGSNPTPPAQ